MLNTLLHVFFIATVTCNLYHQTANKPKNELIKLTESVLDEPTYDLSKTKKITERKKQVINSTTLNKNLEAKFTNHSRIEQGFYNKSKQAVANENAATQLSVENEFISRFNANTKLTSPEHREKSYFESRTVVSNKLVNTTESPPKSNPQRNVASRSNTDNIINLPKQQLFYNQKRPYLNMEYITTKLLELSKRSTIPHLPTTKRSKIQNSNFRPQMKEHNHSFIPNEYFPSLTNKNPGIKNIKKTNNGDLPKKLQDNLKSKSSSKTENGNGNHQKDGFLKISLPTKNDSAEATTNIYQNIPTTQLHSKNKFSRLPTKVINNKNKIEKHEIFIKTISLRKPSSIFKSVPDLRDNKLKPTQLRKSTNFLRTKKTENNFKPTQTRKMKNMLNSTTKKGSVAENFQKYLKIAKFDRTPTEHSLVDSRINTQKSKEIIRRNTVPNPSKKKLNTSLKPDHIVQTEKRQNIQKTEYKGNLIIIDYDKENEEVNEGKRSEIEGDSVGDKQGYTIILNNNGNDDNEAKKEDIYRELKEHFTEMEHHFQSFVNEDNEKKVKVLVITPKSEETGDQRDVLPREPDSLDAIPELKPQFISLNELTDVSKSSQLDFDIDKLKHVKEKLKLLNEDDTVNLNKENESQINNTDAKEAISKKSLSDAEKQIEILENMSNDAKDKLSEIKSLEAKSHEVVTKTLNNVSSFDKVNKRIANEKDVKASGEVHMHFQDVKISDNDHTKDDKDTKYDKNREIKTIQPDDDNLMAVNKLPEKTLSINAEDKKFYAINKQLNTQYNKNLKQINSTNDTIKQDGSGLHSHLQLSLIDDDFNHKHVRESEHKQQNIIHENEDKPIKMSNPRNAFNEKDVDINKNIMINVNKLLRSEKETRKDNQSSNRKQEISIKNESKHFSVTSALEKKQSSEGQSMTKKVLKPPANPSPDASKLGIELQPEIISPTRLMSSPSMLKHTEFPTKQTTDHNTRQTAERTTKSTGKQPIEHTTKNTTERTTDQNTKHTTEKIAEKNIEHTPKNITVPIIKQATKKLMKPTTTNEMPDTKRTTENPEKIPTKTTASKVLDKRKAQAIVEYLNKDPLETWRYHFRSLKSLNLNSSILRSGLVSAGNIDRLKGVMKRALEGKDITLTIVGGSISAGGGLYKDRGNIDGLYYKGLVDWWNKMITPLTGSDMLVNNIAVGSIGTDYFSYCVKNHISKEADIVLWELSANDFNRYKMQPTKGARPLERLTRMILELPYKPALIYVNFFKGVDYKATRESCPNFEDQGEEIIAHYYKIPSLSWRAMVCGGLIRNEPGYGIESLFSLDQYHPSLRGHAQMSLLLLLHLRHVMRAVLQWAIEHNGYIINFERKYNLPEPLFMGPKYPEPLCWTLITPDLNEKIKNSLQVKVVKQLGFRLEYATNFPIRLDKVICWKAERPNAELAIQFFIPELYGTDGLKRLRSEVIITSHTRWGGSSTMWIDDMKDRQIVVKEGRPNDPGKRTQVDSIASDVGPGTHTLNVFSHAGAFCLAAIMIDGS